ncbi:hypothetical protein GCM10018980_34660 [Streptomyces capoamus]|uniref:Uncharacterized protein n=1 Tax=Streptomyces capoamus TaxID=68183 RepID=A0A919C5H6_9ACTN|nr:hypothetical protein GCM10010501_05280 [Streptomyces libani subsp. rufus]GHG51729.1 hypothetical protein GCM10018980_34660 [Streptomyces capoamus]
MWRREVSRGARNGVRPVEPVPVRRRAMIPYLFTRILSLECRSGSVRRQEGVHAWESVSVPGTPQKQRHVT